MNRNMSENRKDKEQRQLYRVYALEIVVALIFSISILIMIQLL